MPLDIHFHTIRLWTHWSVCYADAKEIVNFFTSFSTQNATQQSLPIEKVGGFQWLPVQWLPEQKWPSKQLNPSPTPLHAKIRSTSWRQGRASPQNASQPTRDQIRDGMGGNNWGTRPQQIDIKVGTISATSWIVRWCQDVEKPQVSASFWWRKSLNILPFGLAWTKDGTEISFPEVYAELSNV